MNERQPPRLARLWQAVRAYLADCELAAAEMEAAGSSLDPKSLRQLTVRSR